MPAFVQSVAGGNNGSTAQSLGYTSANTATNLLVAVMRIPTSTSLSTITDSAGNTWLTAAGAGNTNVTGGTQHRVWWVPNAIGNTNTVTAHIGDVGTNRIGLAIAEFSGCTTGTPLDNVVNSTGGSSQVLTATVTTAESSEALVCAGTKGNIEIPSTENGFDNLIFNDNGRVHFCNRMVTATASTYLGQVGFSSGLNGSATNAWGAVFLTFRSTNVAAGGALLSPSGFLPLIGVQMYDF